MNIFNFLLKRNIKKNHGIHLLWTCLLCVFYLSQELGFVNTDFVGRVMLLVFRSGFVCRTCMSSCRICLHVCMFVCSLCKTRPLTYLYFLDHSSTVRICLRIPNRSNGIVGASVTGGTATLTCLTLGSWYVGLNTGIAPALFQSQFKCVEMSTEKLTTEDSDAYQNGCYWY